MSVWLISDPHFGHKNIIKYCRADRFIDTEEMDNIIIENYNRVVAEHDLVFWLGDMFFCGSQRMEYIAQRLHKGRKILIRGNHDKGVSNGKFIKLGFMPYRMYHYVGFLLSHEPVSEANMQVLRSYFAGAKNIHGHTHELETGLDPSIWQCVSVEQTDYKPISFLDVAKRFTLDDPGSEEHRRKYGY